jgi:hypothetical protein
MYGNYPIGVYEAFGIGCLKVSKRETDMGFSLPDGRRLIPMTNDHASELVVERSSFQQ